MYKDISGFVRLPGDLGGALRKQTNSNLSASWTVWTMLLPSLARRRFGTTMQPSRSRLLRSFLSFPCIYYLTRSLLRILPVSTRHCRISKCLMGPTTMNNLATLLQATNRLSEAEPLMRRALEICEASLGAEHPNTVIVRKNLESLLDEM